MFEAEPADVLAMRAVLPADVIIEPEIVHHRLVDAPADFLDTDPLWRGAPHSRTSATSAASSTASSIPPAVPTAAPTATT